MKLSESASCGQGSVYVCVWSPWGLVWVGSFDEETFFSWDSAFCEGSKTLNGSVVYESGNENGSGGEVFPSCCPSLFPETWAFPLSYGFSLGRVL